MAFCFQQRKAMSDRTYMVRASETPSVASGTLSMASGTPCRAGNKAGATATMQAGGKGLELDTSMFSVKHLDVRCDKRKSGITSRVLGLVPWWMGLHCQRVGMGVKLEIPIKCPSEDVRWAVVCMQPTFRGEVLAGDRKLNSPA